jgi:hypothetical protein
VAAASTPVVVAVATLIDCVADAVVALPSRTRGDAAAFDVPASGDGLSAKDEADAADDIKMLVFGSKLGGYAGGQFGASSPPGAPPAQRLGSDAAGPAPARHRRRVHPSSAGLLTDGAAVKAIVLPAGRPREDQTRARSRWAPPRHGHHRLEEALAPAELLVAEIDGNADGDLFGASKASSEKKRNSWSTSYPPVELWNPKWNKKNLGRPNIVFQFLGIG